MTVKELIEKLQQFDEDTPVVDNRFNPVSFVDESMVCKKVFIFFAE